LILSEELLREVDRLIKGDTTRSKFIEVAVQRYITHIGQNKRDNLDSLLLNRYANHLNREALDSISYQIEY
jgi:metal-responsive CopG/Arc/MetJ family transcriptional regulator